AIGALAFACSSTRAMPLADYRARIAQSDGALAQLLKLYETTQDDKQQANTARFKSEEADDLHALRAALPMTEKVEWAGGTVEVNNQWLQDELDAYEKLPPTPIAPRIAALTRIAARLHALAQRLDEVARAQSESRDKSAEKGRLHAILQRPEYNEGAASDSALSRLWTRFTNWLRSLMPEPKPMQPGTAIWLSRAARGLIYALCLAVITFVLWRYGPRLFRRKLTRARAEKRARVVLGEQLAPDETAADLLTEAERLARAGDLRGAMRKAYIAVLCELGDRKILRLAPHKTNRDYLRALRDDARLFQTVQPLTNAYERHWYGLTPASETDWHEFHQRVESLESGGK
ncbi:MAG TPA: DUF4129 domain-containing protein, partial [Pyrinomonadaceae bacterium]|nr:DUF4129 domain-containing protein [Pyrinomonadaceae bacterium]